MADTIYFLLAVAATSSIIFMLMTRAENAGRRSSDDPGTSSASDGWTASWFGSNHYGPSSDLLGSGDNVSNWSGGSDGGIGGGSSN